MSILGSAILFTPVLYLWKLDKIRGKFYVLAAIACCFIVAVLLPEYGFYHHIALGFALFAGGILFLESAALIVKSKLEGSSHGEVLFLVSWFVLFFTLTYFMFPHGAVRYQLSYIVPVVTLFFLSLEHDYRCGIFSKKSLLLLLVLGQVISASVLSLADLELARGYRKSAFNIIERYKTPENRVWIASEWGIRYYAERQGAEAILRYDNRPSTGDIIIKPVLTASTYQTGYESEPYGFLLDKINVESTFPFKILNLWVKAGFYSDYWGLLPGWYSGRNVPLDILNLYMVKKRLPVDEEQQKQNDLGIIGGELPAWLKGKY